MFDEPDNSHEKSEKAIAIYKLIISIIGRQEGDLNNFIGQCFIALTHRQRQKLLMALLDMDLHIWTWAPNLQVLCNNQELFKKCHLEQYYSLSQNEAVYNASTISLNMPHSQVNTGFSWRVCDILASNALLISNPSEDLKRLFGNIVQLILHQKI